MRRTIAACAFVGAMALMSCGGGGAGSTPTAPPPPPPPPVDTTPTGPALVTILTVTTAVTDIGEITVTLHLKNAGGAGAYFLTFWELRSSPSTANRELGNTVVTQVTASYDETLAYRVPVPGAESGAKVDYITVSNAGANSAAYTSTQCYLITTSLGACPP